MVKHHPDIFGSHKYCGKHDQIFLVVEGQDFTYPYLNSTLSFISKIHSMP